MRKKLKSISTLTRRGYLQAPKQLKAASSGIFNIAQTLFHYTNQSCSSKTRIHPAAPANECFSNEEKDYHKICHSNLLMMTVYLLKAVGFQKARVFFSRHNKHRAASRRCCHLEKLFLEKQEKCVG